MLHVPASALFLTLFVCTTMHFGLYMWAKLRRIRIRWVWRLLPILLALPLLVGSFLALQKHWRHQGTLKSGRDWPYSGDSIPPEASNVFIDASYNNRRAKFHIDSAVLLSWCEQKKTKVERLGGDFSTHRYVFDAEFHESKEIEITEGFVASDLWPNGGGFLIVYDSTQGVAYYSWATH